MNTNLTNKYKTRNPLDTISIVKDFFSNLDLELKIYENSSEIGTYSNHIDLYHEKQLIMFSNGKGMSPEYALASGLAELYERFCNHCDEYMNPLVSSKMIEINQKKYGYDLCTNEQKLDLETVWNDNYFRQFFIDLTYGHEELAYKLYNYIVDFKPIGVEYTNIITGAKEYLDPRLIIRCNSSTGMAAGNTFEEAFVQGFSEICERHVYHQVFQADGTIFYPELNLNNITNEQLKERIEAIRSLGNEIHVIDFSYIYNLPVLCIILVNKINHYTHINFGAFPVFDIALERCFTEVYQNHISFNSSNDLIQKPSKCFDGATEVVYNQGGLDREAYLPKNFLNNLVMVDTPSSIFLMPKVDNYILIDYYKRLIANIGWNVVYKDNSKISELSAIHIFARGADVINLPRNLFNPNNIDWYRMERFVDGMYNAYLVVKHNLNYSKELWHDILLSQQIATPDERLAYCFFSRDWTYPYNKLKLNLCELNILLRENNFMVDSNILKDYRDTIFYTNFKKYITIRNYANSDYDLEELNDIFDFLGIDYTDSDINYCNDIYYLCYHIYLETCKNEIISEHYTSYIQKLTQ